LIVDVLYSCFIVDAKRSLHYRSTVMGKGEILLIKVALIAILLTVPKGL
jgi:hypothetical protein